MNGVTTALTVFLNRMSNQITDFSRAGLCLTVCVLLCLVQLDG